LKLNVFPSATLPFAPEPLVLFNPQSEIRNPQFKGACILPLNLIQQVQGAREKTIHSRLDGATKFFEG
jgi:hypothetical protein